MCVNVREAGSMGRQANPDIFIQRITHKPRPVFLPLMRFY